MSALEQEIIEKFRQLPPESRVQMLSVLQEEVGSQQVSLAAWLAEAEAVRITLRPDASGHGPSASELVNEAREERDADILRSIGFGILLATVQTESHTEHAKTLMNQLAQQQMIAPVLLRYELVPVARKWVYRELTTPEKAKTALNTLLRHPVTTIVDDALLHRAYELATEHDRPTAYDAQYLAVAERYQCDFWTADERLYNAVNGKFPRVYWVGNVKLEV